MNYDWFDFIGKQIVQIVFQWKYSSGKLFQPEDSFHFQGGLLMHMDFYSQLKKNFRY